jgi:ketosteroid isomerase-like protein
MSKSIFPAVAAALLCCTWPKAGAHAADETGLSALLKSQTQSFSDAGLKGDSATMARLLDPQVVFTNETGSIVTKQQILDSAAPSPGERHIEVTNWSMTRQGSDLATGTFIDVLTQKSAGMTLIYRYQSTEVWAKRADGWKMIASHTMVVPQDPPAIALEPSQMDEYVGTYQASPELIVRITRAGDGLQSSTNGAAPTLLKAEYKDVMFIPGTAPGVRIFQRDTTGHLVGFLSRRNGNDLLLKKVG